MSKTVELARHLSTLNINNMYKNDFYWTWDKTDDEIDAVFTVADALRDPGSIQHPNTVAARSGPRHGKKGKTLPKIFQLGFESRRRQAVLLHLHKILFRKHIGNRLSVTFILFQQDRRHIDRRPTKRAIKNSDSARFSLHAHGALPACYKKLPSHSHRSKPSNGRSPCPTQRPAPLDRKRRTAGPVLSAGQKVVLSCLAYRKHRTAFSVFSVRQSE